MIIGFTGVKGAGKDTAAQFLIDTYEFEKVAFADPLYEAVVNLFHVPRTWLEKHKHNPDARVNMVRMYNEHGLLDAVEHASNMTLREFLQRFGTEMGRKTFGSNFWVDIWENYLYQNSMRDDDIVVPDVRFQNEVERIASMGGVVVRINRPGHEPDGHESEEPLPSILIDEEISNSGTIDDLKVDVFEFYQGLVRTNVS
jgi:Deoxynucleotide monophosphate kinase